MVAIETRYLGPSDKRGARIVAITCDSWGAMPLRIVFKCEGERTDRGNHAEAFRRLLSLMVGEQMRGTGIDPVWSNPANWHAGGSTRGYMWVWVGGDHTCGASVGYDFEG